MKKLALILLLLLPLFSTPAVEFAGTKLEYMNVEQTNFYGFGVFTSNKRFDAEIEFFLASKVFSGNSDSSAESVGPDYKFFFYSFAGYFHFIRTDKMSWYVGTGIMPLLPKVYVYHYLIGVDFFWSENWRVFYTFRKLYNNAGSYSYPSGTSFAAGVKYAFSFL